MQIVAGSEVVEAPFCPFVLLFEVVVSVALAALATDKVRSVAAAKVVIVLRRRVVISLSFLDL